MRAFTPEEQNAIKKVARGTAGGNLARAVGRAAPRGPVSGTLGGASGAIVGSALGIGPVAGVALTFGAGEVARKIATVLIQRNIRKLEDLIRTGGDSKMAAAALGRARAADAAISAPMRREVTERGRSGRPIATEPLGIGKENAILEAGKMRVGAKASPSDMVGRLNTALQALDRPAYEAIINELRSAPADTIKQVAKEFWGGGTSFASGKKAIEGMMHRFDSLESVKHRAIAYGDRTAG